MWNLKFSRWIAGLLLPFALLTVQSSLAGIEPEVKQVLPRSGVSFATGNKATVYDAVLLNSAGVPA